MKRPLTARESRFVAVALLLFAGAALIAGIGIPVWLLHERYNRFIEEYGDRTMRYRRVADLRSRVEEAIGKVTRQEARKHYLRSNNPALAAAELQERVSKIIESSNGRLLSTQIVPARDEGNFRRIGLSIQLTATVVALQKILYSMESQDPSILVESLNVRAIQGRTYKPLPGVEPELNVQLVLYGYGIINPA